MLQTERRLRKLRCWSRYQATTGEDTTDWEELAHGVVNTDRVN
jgi:hypothetical protein